ncbi:MAG: helix-turn-helix transcriptional regulator, partial [Chitinophagaceae bacterium]|nr:helix-turn-helix transcriptional regulator [Chitinophagaceae bacterium]
IFFVHGLVYSILLLRKGIKNERSSDKWLSFFLLISILYICPWMLGFAGWYNGQLCMNCRNFLFYMPFHHTLLMGPVIFFYVQSLLNPTFKFTKKHWLHLLPGILFIIWNIVVAVTDRVVLKRYFLMDGESDPDFDIWYIAAGLISVLFYLILCLRYYNNYRKFIVQELSFADNVSFKWVGNFLVACFIYFLSSLVMGCFNLVGININYADAWWYYLLFALLFYYIAITGYSNSIESKVKFELDFLKYQMPLQIAAPTIIVEDACYEVLQEGSVLEKKVQEEKASDNPAANNQLMLQWKEKVFEAIVTQKKYQNPELTLTDLAKHLSTNPSLLSKIINQNFEMNFNDFVNFYRVEEVKQKLQDPANANLTIMSIAYDAGFNSKATFNRAFKKLTGKNPKEFIGGQAEE